VRAEVAQIVARRQEATGGRTKADVESIQRRLEKTNGALANVARRVVMVDDDDTAQAILGEANRMKQERETLKARLAALQDTTPAEAEALDAKIERVLRGLGGLEEAYEKASVEGKRRFLSEALATPEGAAGPVVLYFEREEAGKRARVRLVGGRMGVVPIAAQIPCGVGECREGDSNPHSL